MEKLRMTVNDTAHRYGKKGTTGRERRRETVQRAISGCDLGKLRVNIYFPIAGPVSGNVMDSPPVYQHTLLLFKDARPSSMFMAV